MLWLWCLHFYAVSTWKINFTKTVIMWLIALVWICCTVVSQHQPAAPRRCGGRAALDLQVKRKLVVSALNEAWHYNLSIHQLPTWLTYLLGDMCKWAATVCHSATRACLCVYAALLRWLSELPDFAADRRSSNCLQLWAAALFFNLKIRITRILIMHHTHSKHPLIQSQPVIFI